MKQFIFVTILAIAACPLASRSQTIVGEWRRTDIHQMVDTSNLQKRKFGDWVFGSDSTFILIGYDNGNLDTIPGWHSGGTVKGTWRIKEKERLELYEEGFPYPLTYQITLLTNDQLYLRTYTHGLVMKFKKV